MKNITTILRSVLLPSLQGRGWGWVLFFTLLSSLFTSCSQEQVSPDPEEQKPTAIAFNGSLKEEEVTRATTPLEDYTTSFRVWAYKNMSETAGVYGNTQMVFPGFTVRWINNSAATSTTNSDGWEYILDEHPDQQPKYWDWSAKAYRFFGSAEMSATPGTWEHITEGTERYKYTCTPDATSAEDAPFYTHLWFSNGNATDYPTRQFGQLVTLEFIKPFAEVVFRFTYSNPDATPLPAIEEADFRPLTEGQRIALMGEVEITFPITGAATQETWESTPEYTKFLTAFTTKDTPYEVFPIRNQGAYRLTVTVNGADKECIVPDSYTNWSPGYRYTYVFKVNDEGGVELETVKMGVTTWTNVTPVDYNLYNW